MHAQPLKTEDARSASADAASIATGLLAVDGGETHLLDIPGENKKRMFPSKSVPASAVNRQRNLQESQASTCETSVAVTSSIFPLLEGCLAPTAVDGFDVAYVSDTGFVGYGEPTIIVVEGYDIGVRTNLSNIISLGTKKNGCLDKKKQHECKPINNFMGQGTVSYLQNKMEREFQRVWANVSKPPA